MKWYTLEERPIEKGKTEAFLMVGQSFYNEENEYGSIWVAFIWMNTLGNLVHEEKGEWLILGKDTIIHGYIPTNEIKASFIQIRKNKDKERNGIH